MMQFYPGNKTGGIPGLFGEPYYWWEAGAVFGVCFSFFLFLILSVVSCEGGARLIDLGGWGGKGAGGLLGIYPGYGV